MSVLVNANEHQISKAFIPAKTRRKEASKGDALPDGSFPIRNKTDLLHAREDLGRTSPAKRAKARKLIARRSSQLEKSASMAKCPHGMNAKECKICSRKMAKAADERTAARRSGHAKFRALNNSRAGEVIKAYTSGTITYHQAAAREEGRKKRSSESVARAGAATAIGGSYAHTHADKVGSALRVKPAAVKSGAKAAIVAGGVAAGAGVASAAVHGVKRSKHFKAAQAGRLEREPAISKAFGVVVAKASLGALDDIAMAPAKVSNIKNALPGGSNAATVPPAKKKILAPITASANDTTPTASAPLPGQSTLTKSAFGPSL